MYSNNKLINFMLKVPGGTFIIPLLLGTIINTVMIFTKTSYLYEGAISTVTTVLFAIQIFAAGTQVEIKGAPKLLARSFVLLIVKFLSGFIVGYLMGLAFGKTAFVGITSLACIAALTNSNGGMFFSLINQYGSPEEAAVYTFLGFNDGPYLTMIAMSAAGLAVIPLKDVLIAFSPMLIGIILGSVLPKTRPFMRKMFGLFSMLFAVSLGFKINLMDAAKCFGGGLILGLACVIFTGIPLVFVDRKILKQQGYCGAAVASIAGNAVATPLLVAQSDPGWGPYVQEATTVISASIIMGSILTPLFTAFIAKKFGCPALDKKQNNETEK